VDMCVKGNFHLTYKLLNSTTCLDCCSEIIHFCLNLSQILSALLLR